PGSRRRAPPRIFEGPAELGRREGFLLRGRGFLAPSGGSGGLGGQDSPSDPPLLLLRSQVDGRQAFLPPDPAGGWGSEHYAARTGLPAFEGFPPGPARISIVTGAVLGPSRPVFLRPAARP
ncbi:MAG: hypothetical protein MI919_22930, partial [Holophagales bacterium]|nr:hypothetical protein [Holophagales bacterium]